MKQLAIALLLTSAALQAVATGPIYRCGTSYSQTPCPGGKLVDAADPRSAAQRAEALRVTAKERRDAAQLERERHVREAADKASAAKASASGPQRGKAKKKRAKLARIVPLKAP
ncbi:MAG TPA: hypothetical protein VKI18_15660 [Albitalea sp.]|nr:hypothetical protein [Albitalea sp.]